MRASARSIWASFSRSLLSHGQLVVALEAGRAHVGLVVAGAVTGVAHQVVQLVLGEVELASAAGRGRRAGRRGPRSSSALVQGFSSALTARSAAAVAAAPGRGRLVAGLPGGGLRPAGAAFFAAGAFLARGALRRPAPSW